METPSERDYESERSNESKSKYRIDQARKPLKEKMLEEKNEKKKKKELKTIEDVKDWLMEEELPNKNEAIEVLKNEADFFKFQQIWMNRNKIMKPVEPEILKEYDEIKMAE